MERVYAENIQIDEQSLKEFYRQRAVDKISINVDAPVVLCSDRDESKIEEWTSFEIEHRFPDLKLNSSNVVLEVGCGTGRISKYITGIVDTFVGIDYVEEFIDLIRSRNDIKKKKTTYFIHSSVQSLARREITIPTIKKFDRFVISGGVLMYINDAEVKELFNELITRLDDRCIIYLSEPIALKERLTLNKFYSEDLASEYSAIYRTEKEYQDLFSVFYKVGFKATKNEEFFYEDIKSQKETKQWMFVLERQKV
ncbi:class I SAM-dependent methyltransferase [Priestia koreensis]|uniref:class I SAM-dependent methyltransferase n=1 Tax=Priestia koreensis TaxID=284581 RepID=UPI0034573DE2